MRLRLLGLIAVTSFIGFILLPFVYTSRSRQFVEVTIPADGYQIAGYLSEGTNLSGPWIILAHGNRKEGQSHELYNRIANNLSGEVGILSIDFRGFGRSSAEGMSFSANILDRTGDIDAAVEYLRQTYGVPDDRISLVGHSLGSLQVLKAAGDRRYSLVVPIGPADFEVFLTDGDRMQAYIKKFRQNTGVELTPESMLREGAGLSPQKLFTPCPETPIAMVFASNDLSEALLYNREIIPDDCDAAIQWITIPLSNHMYGTEGGSLPGPLQQLHSNLSLSLLTWRLNQLLTD